MTRQLSPAARADKIAMILDQFYDGTEPGDLLADLLHYCDRNGYSIGNVLQGSLMCYEDDIGEPLPITVENVPLLTDPG